MPTKSSRTKRRMKRMMAHRNRRHRMNFMVLYGDVNQRKEVSGRLEARPQGSAGNALPGLPSPSLAPKLPRRSASGPRTCPHPCSTTPGPCPLPVSRSVSLACAALFLLGPPTLGTLQDPVLSHQPNHRLEMRELGRGSRSHHRR